MLNLFTFVQGYHIMEARGGSNLLLLRGGKVFNISNWSRSVQGESSPPLHPHNAPDLFCVLVLVSYSKNLGYAFYMYDIQTHHNQGPSGKHIVELEKLKC